MWIEQWMRRCSELVTENREYLIELDRVIGDADHGENLDRGFRAVVEYLATTDQETPADLLRGIGFTLIAHVGGASGPLYGTAFTRMGEVAAVTLTPTVIAAMLDRAMGGIQKRGHVQVGEKTMFDVWSAVADVANQGVDNGADIVELCELVDQSACEAAQATIDMVATQGRASYLGERTVGHMDPGAASSQLIFQALHESVS
ncbi:dihydroxyacetone kinase subunit DhaL [Arcanobacterium pinnipediorum]|uniref:Dihydroxyacetone kinase subunit DhaL n=1 Tax=Arcanobacterium pinnipediorum TaxID=1503041 RepID=A0ABY5ALE4_9ACTO|nr:dihydroxyacetone kinase subunit DhaL [Arcanobacterium pinnipediorum]USR80221.1 dihydroxyacetone kinase subunit DhaL [Arcanobacterium pinnipediorum]